MLLEGYEVDKVATLLGVAILTVWRWLALAMEGTILETNFSLLFKALLIIEIL